MNRCCLCLLVDAKDMLLIERGEQDLVQRARGFEIAAEWLFDDDARAVHAPCACELLNDRSEK